MMPAVKETAYDQYMDKVRKVQVLGMKNEEIVRELFTEIRSIAQRKRIKCSQLALCRSPYPSREAVRAALECITAIERIIGELQT